MESNLLVFQYVRNFVTTIFFIFITVCFLFSSCTYSMILTDTHGTASDVVDEQQTPTADIKPDISIPISAVPSIPLMGGK